MRTPTEYHNPTLYAVFMLEIDHPLSESVEHGSNTPKETAEKEFHQKVILITGSSHPRGIGAAAARLFAQEGAQAVIISGREKSSEMGLQVKRELDELGTEGIWQHGDIADPDTSHQLIRGTMERFGKLDVIVNSAGIVKDNPINRMSIDDWNDVLNTNLNPAFYLPREAFLQKAFKRDSGDAVVHIGSIIGIYGNRGQENYAASKAALIGLTRSQAKEFGSRNIRVNTVAPGFIDTDITSSTSPDVRDAIISVTPLRRLGTPEDVANLIVFLASSKASFITGQTFEIDGGLNGAIEGVYGMMQSGYRKDHS